LLTDPTSTTSSEVHINNNLLASNLPYLTLLKRTVLDESAQWIEDILIVLEKVEDTSRKSNNSVLEYMDLVFIESEFGQYTRIMTGITENMVKYTYYIAKLELELLDNGQEQSRALGRNKTASYSRRLTTGYTL
jgi:hypothetical protein